MNTKDIIKLIDDYWKFDENQQHMSSWHDKQDLLELIQSDVKKEPMKCEVNKDNQQMVDILHKNGFDYDLFELQNEHDAKNLLLAMQEYRNL